VVRGREAAARATAGQDRRGTAIEALINTVLLAFLAVIALAIVRVRNLFAVVMLGGIYSLLSASIFVILDAVDVAFTEAAVGAGVSTILMLGTLALTTNREKIPAHTPLLPLVVVFVTGAMLVYGTADLPPFGTPTAPIHQHVAPYYLDRTPIETGVPNVVTAVLASYRGYDTLGELTVIFTAGIGVLLLLGRIRTAASAGGRAESPAPTPGGAGSPPRQPAASRRGPNGTA
jgi:multicomponent Na+:H+ antiporter subunit B